MTDIYRLRGTANAALIVILLTEKRADELMHLAAYLAGNEQARTEAQQKAGKKA